MRLRWFIMAMLYSILITFVGYFNSRILIIGHELGVDLANFIGIDPYMTISIAGVGIAYDVMFLLFFVVLIFELIVAEDVYIALDKFDTFLWKLLKC